VKAVIGRIGTGMAEDRRRYLGAPGDSRPKPSHSLTHDDFSYIYFFKNNKLYPYEKKAVNRSGKAKSFAELELSLGMRRPMMVSGG